MEKLIFMGWMKNNVKLSVNKAKSHFAKNDGKPKFHENDFPETALSFSCFPKETLYFAKIFRKMKNAGREILIASWFLRDGNQIQGQSGWNTQKSKRTNGDG